MIAAAFGLSAERARRRLERLAGDGDFATTSTGAVAVWPSVPAGRLSGTCAGTCASIGERVGASPRGPFASVGIDDGALVLARGHFGGRTLYYQREGDTVVACSHLEPLLRSADRSPELDPEGLAGFLDGRGDLAATPFRDTRRVLPGEVLRFTERAERSSTALIRGRVALTGDELLAEVRRRLIAAVARAIGDAKRVAVTVSGGLDSSAILAIAVAHARGASDRELTALNIAFEAEGNDQLYLADLLRDLAIEPVTVRPEDFARDGLDAMTTDARPLALLSSLWQVSLAREARSRGAEVILTGTGGDDFFDGDLSLLEPSWDPRRLLAATRKVLTLRGIYYASKSPLARARAMIARPMLRSLVPERLRAMIRPRRPAEPDWAGPALREYKIVSAPGSDRFEELAHDRTRLDYVDARTQVEIASGLRAADPFFDPELLELLSGLPPEAFFTGGYVRGLLRGAMRGMVPERLLRREDKGRYEPAFAAHFRALGGVERVRPLLEMRGLGALGLVDPSRFRARFERFANDLLDPGGWIELWPVIACEALVREWQGS